MQSELQNKGQNIEILCLNGGIIQGQFNPKLRGK
jgi:hypothetical protein